MDRSTWSFYRRIPDEGTRPSADDLRYRPGSYNLALMDLFGFVEIDLRRSKTVWRRIALPGTLPLDELA